MANAVWTVEIGGTSRKYKEIPSFTDQLKSDTPSEISGLLVEYDGTIDYWDVIEFKRNGTSEWKGFVETMNIVWQDGEGRYYEIGGRNNSLILWKKFNENFSNMQEGTEGFFGQVSASELIKLLLRCPESDLGSEYPNNKSGWGIDVSKILAVHAYYADVTKESMGDPDYIFLRRRGLGWRNCGVIAQDELDVNSVVSNQWGTNGTSPYLDAEDDSWIKSNSVADQYAIFGMANLSALATGLRKTSLVVAWKPDASFWGWGGWGIQSDCWVYLSKDAGVSYSFVGRFGGRLNPLISYPWWHYVFPIDLSFWTSVSELQGGNLRVKFVNKSVPLATYITHCYLDVVYEEGGTQAVGDEIDVIFEETENVCGIYMESRADNISYPRNYGVVKVTDDPQDYREPATGEYTQVDPSGHITATTATHIDHNQSMQISEYAYRDMGAGFFGLYFTHSFTVKVNTDPFTSGATAGVWAVSNVLTDYWDMRDDPEDSLALAIVNSGSGPMFRFREVHDGISHTSDSSIEITEGTTYQVTVKRVMGKIQAYIYDNSGVLLDAIAHNMTGTADTYRYAFATLSCNTGDAYSIDLDFDGLDFEEYTSLDYKNSNTYRDVISSWTPQTLSHIKIRISDTSTHSWSITQLYIYKSCDLDYRVWYEGGTAPSYPLNQYIQSVSIDSEYTPAIGPLNIPEGRLLNTLFSFVQKLNESYVPFDVWMANDSSNTFHVKNSRGSNISATVSFVLGENLEGTRREQTVQNTVQRVKVIGSGEGQEEDQNSSDWTVNIPATVNSWYEDVLTEKEVTNKTLANMLANIHLSQNKDPIQRITLNVSYDEYATGTYGLGDTITITDALVDLATTSKIYSLTKSVDSKGEHVKVYCGAPKEDIDRTWADIYERLKKIERAGVIKADWTAEGQDNRKIDPNQMETMFEATGRNDTVDTQSNSDVQWVQNYTNKVGGTERGRTTSPSYGLHLDLDKDNGIAQGPDGADSGDNWRWIMIERRYDDVNDGHNEFHDIPLWQNPKMALEVKVFEVIEGTPLRWYTGDTFDFGFKEWGDDTDYPLQGSGYWFRIQCTGEGVFKVYGCWADDNYNETKKFICYVDSNIKYRYEIITDKDRRQVRFEVWDVEKEADLPYAVVRTKADITQTVRPFHACMYANHNDEYVATAYLYRLKIEYKRAG